MQQFAVGQYDGRLFGDGDENVGSKKARTGGGRRAEAPFPMLALRYTITAAEGGPAHSV